MNILLVGGNWDLSGGRKSKIVNLFKNELPNATVYNGGNYFDLCRIVSLSIHYDVVLWWANVPNDLPKIRNIKEVNYKAMLVTSKRNNDEYSFEDLLQRSLEAKANLTIEFRQGEKRYNMRLFDPLGNLWYDGTSISKCTRKMLDRLEFLQRMTREKTFPSQEKIDIKDDIFDNSFINIVRYYATIFAEVIFQTKDVKRFLGNASFRCPKGFPSFRHGNLIFVSKRNVNKEHIGINDFVPVYIENGKIFYIGDNKPSVDTPVQLKLYDKLTNINYMIHSHCYIKDAPFTKKSIPCGAIEEVKEIFDAIKEHYDNDYAKDFYVFNLKGHGSIMMSKESKQLENLEIIGRNLPEVSKN